MTKIGDAFFNINHVLAVYPTTTRRQTFDFQSGKNFKPSVMVVSAIDGKETNVVVGNEYTNKNTALILAQEYVSKIDFTQFID
jgi:hypothetical protein